MTNADPLRDYDGIIIRPLVERRHDWLFGRCYHCMESRQYFRYGGDVDAGSDTTPPLPEPGPELERAKREAFRRLALHIAIEHGVVEPRIRTLWDRER